MTTTTTRETVGKLISTQTVVPAWMQKLADEHGHDGEVDVTRKVTPFGTFVGRVEIVENNR